MNFQLSFISEYNNKIKLTFYTVINQFNYD